MQLKLFDDTIILEDELLADSPRKAFYRLKLVLSNGTYKLIKESGANGKVLDRRIWLQKDCHLAEKTYRKKISNKLNPDRKNPRKYVSVKSSFKN